MSIIATRSMAPRLKGKITALLTICSICSTSLNYDINIYNFIAHRVCKIYLGKRRNEVPSSPLHLQSSFDFAYP